MFGHKLDVKRHFRAYEEKGLKDVKKDDEGAHQPAK